MMEYWPWWLGAVALAGITVGFCVTVGRPLGVSGSWARVVGWRESRARERVEAPLRNNPSALNDALLAATLAEFGEQETFETLGTGTAVRNPTDVGDVEKSTRATDHTSWAVHLTFLLSMMVGGLLAALSTGNFQWHLDLGDAHKMFFGNGLLMWIALLFGGAMVGFGTQMGGGCTSGHGLSGCSRLVPASLFATAVFFGSAVAVSLLVEVIAK